MRVTDRKLAQVLRDAAVVCFERLSDDHPIRDACEDAQLVAWLANDHIPIVLDMQQLRVHALSPFSLPP